MDGFEGSEIDGNASVSMLENERLREGERKVFGDNEGRCGVGEG